MHLLERDQGPPVSIASMTVTVLGAKYATDRNVIQIHGQIIVMLIVMEQVPVILITLEMRQDRIMLG